MLFRSNTSTSAPQAVTFGSSLSGKLKVTTYKAGNQNSFGTKTTTGATTSAAVARGIGLPAESITLLQEG